MEIRLKNEWMGHKKGSILNLIPNAAKRLIKLGTAESLEVKKKEKEVKQEVAKEVKAVSEPPKDKMVRRPKRKK